MNYSDRPERSDRPQQPKGPYCQSCGMPLRRPEVYGTNADGSASTEFCKFCYQNGTYTQPNITMEQMIEKVADIMARRGHDRAESKRKASTYIVRLKRWRGNNNNAAPRF